MSLEGAPLAYLGFASLHVAVGHFGAAAAYGLRFGRNPLVLYRARATPHARATRLVGALSIGWAAALVASALSPGFRATFAGRPRFAAPDVASWGVAVFGLVAMVASQLSMGRAFRVGQDDGDAPDALRTRGAHALSRNPIYVGSWLYLAGMTLWCPNALLFALLAALGLGMHRLVLAEEAFLEARFGDAFRRYRARTPRYFFGPSW